MSCLRHRLQPARKAWKSFTSKLQSKLHKPKGIHKPRRNRVNTITSTAAAASASAFVRLRPYKYLQLRFQRKPRLALRLHFSRRHLLHNNHHHAHEHVDKLFKEPAVSDQAKCPQSTSTKYIKPREPDAVPGSTSCKPAAAATNESEAAQSTTCAEDDIWESLRFASPLMHGIDERAEKFIARFRRSWHVICGKIKPFTNQICGGKIY